jgi:chromosome partitioning protein
MPTYVFAHTKGGVTKTTTCLNMAVMRQMAGRRVLLVDSDSGQSTTSVCNARKLAGLPDVPHVSLVSYPLEGGGWYRIDPDIQRLQNSGKYDDILIDAGGEGHGSPEIRGALLVADVVVTPCRPPKLDSERLTNMNSIIGEVRSLNPKLRALLFPSAASTNAKKSDVTDFYANVAKFREYTVMDAVVRDRDAYKKLLETAEVIVEQKRPPKEALNEMAELYKEIFA